MSRTEFEKLQQDYQKLFSQYWDLKQSSEARIEALQSENRRLEDECKGRGYWLIALCILLVFSVLLGIFVH